MTEIERKLMQALVDLNGRMKAVEESNAANLAVFNQNLIILVDRIDAIEAKVEGLSQPIVVDANGEVVEVTAALVEMFDSLQAAVKEDVTELKAWFHQHLDEHDRTWGRPTQVSLKQIDDFLKKDRV